MISQRCPRCGSKRIRRGYRPTPVWSKILFRYHLLCDSCNWEFTGFAVPGTVSTKSTKKPKKSRNVEENKPDAVIEKEDPTDLLPTVSPEKKVRKKRVKKSKEKARQAKL